MPSQPAAFPAASSIFPPTPLAAGSEVFCALAACITVSYQPPNPMTHHAPEPEEKTEGERQTYLHLVNPLLRIVLPAFLPFF